MHTTLGYGKKKIIYLNSDQNSLIQDIFFRLIHSFHTNLTLGNPNTKALFHKVTLIMSDEIPACNKADLSISFSMRYHGILTDSNAYSKQFALFIQKLTDIPIISQKHSKIYSSNIILGLRDMRSACAGYYQIREAMMTLPTLL